MFPPASPFTDRVRAQADLDALEQDAILYANTQPSRPSLLQRLSLRRPSNPQPVDQPVCTINRNPSAAES